MPLVPIATRLLARDFSVSAAVPIEVAPKAAAAPLEIVATVIGADGAARELARESRGAAEFTKPGGQVYALPLALHTMAPGEYRLKIEATLGGRSKASRELPLTIVQ